MDNENNRDDLPSIETRRLFLRALKMSDTDDIFEYASDPEVSKHTFWDTHESIEDTQRFILQQIRGFQLFNPPKMEESLSATPDRRSRLGDLISWKCLRTSR